MQSFWSRLAGRIQGFWSTMAVQLGKRVGLVSAVGLIITGLLAFGITRLEFATSQDSYLNEGDAVFQDNVTYQNLFGGQAMLSVFRMEEGTTLVDFLRPENQQKLERIQTELTASDEIQSAITPLTALEFSDSLLTRTPGGEPASNPTESIAGGALLDAVSREDSEEAVAARTESSQVTLQRFGDISEDQRTLANPAWRELLLFDNQGEIRKSLQPFFPNERTTQMITRLEGNQSIEEEGAGAELTTETVREADFAGATTTTVGAPTLLQDINNYLRGGILTLGAIAVGMMVIILSVLFDVRWRLLPLLVILVGVTWAFGLAGYLGIPLSLVTISGLPVMLGVGIDYAIQLHSRVEEEVVIDRETHPIQATARNLGPALLVVTIDAVLAFLALRFAQVPMIRDFGSLLMVGIAAICLCSIIVPLALLGIREYKSPTRGRDFREGRLGKVVVKLGSLPAWSAVPFAIASVLILVGGISVEDDLAIQADPVDWVDQSSGTIERIDTVRAQTGSSSELGVYVTSPDVFDQNTVDYVHNLAYCALGDYQGEVATRRCEGIEQQFVEQGGERVPALLSASSVVTTMSYLLDVPGATPLAPRAEDVQAAYEVAPRAIKASTAKPIDEVPRTALNLIFRTGYSSLDDGEAVVNNLRTETTPPANTEAVPSGLAVVGVGLLENIEENRALLTYLSIIFVGLFLMVRLRSVIRSLLSLVPVLIATGTASLAAFALSIELSPMTAVGGPLVVAICTEFTSLILLRFVEERRRGMSPREAADTAAARTGRAFIVSALTGITGVGVIAASSLPLLRDFGQIIALNVSIALLAALVILPPMLVWADRRRWVSRRLVDRGTLDATDARVSRGEEPPEPPQIVDAAEEPTPAGQS